MRKQLRDWAAAAAGQWAGSFRGGYKDNLNREVRGEVPLVAAAGATARGR